MTIGGVIAGIGGGIFAHYTTHIEHAQFGVVLATFAVAYPILGGLSNVFGTLLAVIFIQGFLIEGLRFMGDWRNLLFGGLIVLAMNVRPRGLLDAGAVLALKRLFFRARIEPVLDLEGLTKHFGGVRAVDGVDLTVARGEILGLIGPNGSGKSTIVNLICGLFPPTAGRVVFDGADISGLPPHARVTLGHCAHVPEHPPVRAIDGLAESLGRAEFRRAAPREFSRALARRLARRPRRDRPHARVLRSRAQARRTGRQSGIRRAAAARIRPRARRQARLAAARRAGGGHERRGNRSARRPHPQAAPGRHHHAADRAPCGAGHVGRGPHRGAQFRPEDRRRRRPPPCRPTLLVREAYLGTAAAA